MAEGVLTGELQGLARHDGADLIEAVVVEEFRTTLLMSPEETVPLDAGFFDELGLTSLRLTEIKRRLEDRLGCYISATAMFNRPTVRQLVAHLADVLLPVDAGPAVPEPPVTVPSNAGAKAMLDDLLDDLYRP